ncbi:MAG: PD-(D/E)XK nuclease family protein [Candidatus Aminicenantes bacterium]|nr:PD-(D/E)XK nuclease family protein [Candidatus Aminicenantes bacterium]
MKIKLLEPEIDVIEVVALEILPSAPDFSSIMVVFPEKRPSYYLRKFLAQKLGRAFLPPACFSIDDFIDFIYGEKLLRQDKKLIPLEAIGLLYEIHQKSPSPFGGSFFLNFDQFFSLGLHLYKDLEELKQAQVKPEDLRQADSLIQLNLPGETALRLQKLSYFYENFYREIDLRGFSTPASRLNFILENFSDHLFLEEKIILIGFFSLTKSEAALIKKLLKLPQTELYVIAAKGLEYFEKLLDLSLRKEGLSFKWENREIRTELKFCMAPDTHGQIFALNREIKDKLENPTSFNEKQVIVLPAAETLFPLYHQTLSSLPEASFNISLGYPLSRTPLYSFFDCLFNLIQSADEEKRFYLPEYLRFVLHPYTKNIYFPVFPRRSDLTRILFHLLEQILSREPGSLFWTLEEIEKNPELIRAVAQYVDHDPDAPEPEVFLTHLKNIHQKTISPFLKIENLGHFARKSRELTTYIAEESTASYHAFFEPYFQVFTNLLENLERSTLASFRFDYLTSYFNFFRKIVAETTVPFPGTPLQGLQVLGFWETRCLPFEEVYLLDINEEVLPASKRIDSILPYAVRKAFGLPTYEELEKRVEYYLDILIRKAKKVYFYFIENREKGKSRLVERLIWEKQKREKQPDSLALINSVRYQVALHSSRPKPVSKSQAILAALNQFVFSASALDTYLQCPLKFYYGFVLKLEEREELVEPIEKKTIGTLVHRILEEFFKPLRNRQLYPNFLREELLKEIIVREAAATFGQNLTGSAWLIRHQIENHLIDFLRNYQLPIIKEHAEERKPYLVLGLEQKVEEEMEIDGLLFKASIKVDRVEKRDNQIFIIDYKTTSQEKNYRINWDKLDLSARMSWPEAINSLQLPFYIFVWSKYSRYPVEEIRAILLLLGKNRLDRKNVEFWPFDEDLKTRYEQLQIIKGVIKELILEIINPAIPFSSDYAREGSCDYCPYTSLCGQ